MEALEQDHTRQVSKGVGLVLLWLLWQAIRLPVLGVLVILEPLVRIVLSGFALVGTLTAFLFEFGGTRPFPFFGMLAVSLGALGLLAIYECFIQLLSGRRE